MNNHYYGDLSNLNAPYDVVPLQGLGADDPKYPWKKNSWDTLYLQQDINEGLTAAGKCLIEEDGYLGASTCGALKYLIDQGAPVTMVSTCTEHGEFPAPRSKPNCSAAAAVIDPSAPPGSEENPIDLDAIGENKVPAWAIGVGVGVLAIGVALYLKKNKKRR